MRAPHAITGQRMDFVAKIVVTFNEGKCPYFDTGDGALLKRMLIVQHRSCFGGELTLHESNIIPELVQLNRVALAVLHKCGGDPLL